MKFYANVTYSGGIGKYLEADSEEAAFHEIYKYIRENCCKESSHISVELKRIDENTKEPVNEGN